MHILDLLNDWLWSYVVITMLVVCAVYFTIRMRGMQFRLLSDMVRVIFERPGNKQIGPFQAFAVSLSSRVGTGNLAGVASAIFVGGPGAIFWMWVMALLGSATAFVESTLAQLYKRRGAHAYFGGPSYYMTMGLHRRWMGVLFAVMITLTFGIFNQVVQSTTLCDALSDAFVVSKVWIGVLLSVATLAIVFGGVRRISRFASLVVPFMAIGFVLLSVVVVVMNIERLPGVFRLIFESAFGVHQVAGGAMGAAIMQGVRRGLFSNEAGEGSAPNAAAIAETSHPVKQGLLQAFGVFTDTLVICSCTAFIILLSGCYDCGKDGILLTSEALSIEVGPAGRYFITAAIFLFAYSTIIANYFYGETNITFITHGRRWPIVLFRILTGVTIMVGALVNLQTAFSMVDLVMGLMTLINLVAILQLSPQAFRLLRHYEEQRKQGKNPVFRSSDMPDLEQNLACWGKKDKPYIH